MTLEQQIKLLKKGAEAVHSESELKEKLKKSQQSGKPLVVKLGLDPTAPDIHLGHTVVLRKIRQFQSLGHKAFIIIGDFTGRIGDPTGKSKGRKQLSEKEVLENAETYRRQLFKVLDPDKTVLCFNSEWLGEMKINELIGYLSKQTVSRILERDSFKRRMNEQKPIGLHELIYPLLQGIDSLKIEADIEIGGTDQTFNILTGREMQHKEGKEKQAAIMMPILVGTDGVEKMSKSLNNYIGINESSEVMYEKLMSIDDRLIIPYFNLVTDIHPDRIEDFKQQIESGRTNPKNLKMRLAKEVVTMYHGELMAKSAEERFVHVFSKGQVPKDAKIFEMAASEVLIEFLTRHRLVQSKSEVRRLVDQKGIKINDEIVDDFNNELVKDDLIRIGKKKFVQVG